MTTTTLPKYLRVKRQLVREIESSQFPAGSAFPSEYQLLKRFDVSRPTLIRSLTELVNEGYLTRQRGKGTFVAQRHPPAQDRATGQHANSVNPFTVFIAQDTANLSGPAREIQLRILRGIQEALGESYNAAAIRQTQRDKIDKQTRAFLESTPPGTALLIEPSCFTALKQLLIERSWEVWSINEKTDDTHCVYIDQNHAGYLATRYLIDAGCSKIALLNGPCGSYWGFEARKQGYLEAMTEAGLPINPKRMPEMAHGIDSEAGRAMMRQLNEQSVDVDGVVGASDSKAMGAMAYAIEQGHDVPRQIKFVSIDNTLADQAERPLPAVALPFETMGFQAASQAQFTQAQHRNLTACITQICLRPTLVER